MRDLSSQWKQESLDLCPKRSLNRTRGPPVSVFYHCDKMFNAMIWAYPSTRLQPLLRPTLLRNPNRDHRPCLCCYQMGEEHLHIKALLLNFRFAS